jgi:TetR/AcrR family transcriptional regulator, cholesterol catabolism regulator
MNTRTDLISAATKVFATRGYRATSLRDIAEAAGIQRGSVYHHVTSKEELLLEGMLPALEQTTLEVERVIESALAEEKTDYEAALRQAITTHMHCLYGNVLLEGVKAYLAENLLATHSDLTSEAKSLLRMLTKRHELNFARLYDAGVKAGVFRHDLDSLLESYLVLGMCNWVSRWYRPDGRWSLERVSDSIAATALAGALAQ